MFLQSSASDIVRAALCPDIVTDPLRCGIDLFYEIPSLALRLGLSLAVFAAAALAWVAIVAVAVYAARIIMLRSCVITRRVYGMSVTGVSNLRQKLSKTKVARLMPTGQRGSEHSQSSDSSNKITAILDSVSYRLTFPRMDKIKTMFKKPSQQSPCVASYNQQNDDSMTSKQTPQAEHSHKSHDEDTMSAVVKPFKRVLSPRVSFGRSHKA